MKTDFLHFEKLVLKDGYSCIAGLDEAGRGPLAGPVVSGAVVLPESFQDPEITDSKKLTPKKRDILFDRIHECAISVGVGIIEPDEIDRINILRAALLSMAHAVDNLSSSPDYLLIDGPYKIPSKLPQMAIKKGDSLSISISAASVIAKVTRDRLMGKYHEQYPQYNFIKHKGYPTKAHKEAIQEHGPCPIHRRSFKGVKEHVAYFRV